MGLAEFIGYFTTDFSFIDNVMHLCSWPHCNRCTINSFMMMMMMMMMMSILYCFRDRRQNFPTPVCFAPPLKGFPLELGTGARGQKL